MVLWVILVGYIGESEGMKLTMGQWDAASLRVLVSLGIVVESAGD